MHKQKPIKNDIVLKQSRVNFRAPESQKFPHRSRTVTKYIPTLVLYPL